MINQQGWKQTWRWSWTMRASDRDTVFDVFADHRIAIIDDRDDQQTPVPKPKRVNLISR
jgi:predicted DCC family thiol-disulfide oxidoreductase YuxK